MAHRENYFTFFLPESPPGFIANDVMELGRVCLEYLLAEKVYLNPLFKPRTGFITRVASTT